MVDSGRLRVAAVADLHFGKTTQGTLQPLFGSVPEVADVLLLCGDLTHHGLADEAILLAKELSFLRVPMIGVLGNHDHHSDQQEQIQSILGDAGITILDGDTVEVAGVGFAGVKGFASGFGTRVLEPWGEALVKAFVHEAVTEALKLESALSRLRTTPRVALLHYAPIAGTVEGEPLEIYPFLGSSRLEEPLNRFAVAAAFHGHAHHGQLESRTSAGCPVFNVSLPLLRSHAPEGPAFRVFEVSLHGGEDGVAGKAPTIQGSRTA
jgi:Icc-related predicted phosphoesterase